MMGKTKYIVLMSIEDHRLAVDKFPFERRKNVTISTINNLVIRMTDCSRIFDHMMECLDKAIILIKNLSSKEMYEVVINLDKKGIENLQKHLFREWDHSNVNIWDYRKIQKTIKLVEDIRNRA